MKVFTSYSTKDLLLANKLYAALQDRAISAWIDRMEIRPGDSLIKKIKEGIESSDALLVLITKNSVRSKWVQKEVRIASSLQRKEGAPRIIPLVVAPCKIPNSLKDIRYLSIDRKKFNMAEIIEAIYPDSFVLRIILNRSDLKMNKDLLLDQFTDYYRSNYQHVRVYIENHNFNEKVKQIIKKTLSEEGIPPVAVTQIRGVNDELSVALPAFWTSLTIIFEQLIADLIAKYDRRIGNLRAIAYSIESIMDYSLFSLSIHLYPAVSEYSARSNCYEDIARFIGYSQADDTREFTAERLSEAFSMDLSSRDLKKIDLVGKEQILHGKVYVRPLSEEDYLDLQVGVPVAISPMGFRWYDVYLPQIIGLHILVWSLGRGKILQGDDTKVGLHMEDYKKAGIA